MQQVCYACLPVLYVYIVCMLTMPIYSSLALILLPEAWVLMVEMSLCLTHAFTGLYNCLCT